MAQLNRKLLNQLERRIGKEAITKLSSSYIKQQQSQHKKVNTPATNCTASSWRKQSGNAIDKFKRRRKINQGEEECEREESVTESKEFMDDDGNKNSSKIIQERILIKNKAVFFGQNCELPYLHSTDAINHLYTRKQKQSSGKQEILFNPSSSLDCGYMTSLKSLHIYHTSIESLRQLGTGWCNLKELSILYGRLVDISGLSSFSSLQYLFLAFNQIASLSDLMFHPSIRCIDLERNRIQNSDEIEYLATIEKLEYINLSYNPVMKTKETRRIIQQKLGKILDNDEYTRLVNYECEEMAKTHSLLSYQNMEVSNSLIKYLNQLLSKDQITLQNLYESYQKASSQQNKELLDILRYEARNCNDSFDGQMDQSNELEQDEQVIFTPLIHFLSGKKIYTSIITKYFQNKTYLNIKKPEGHSKSPAHALSMVNSNSRLNKFVSTRLKKQDEGLSLDNKETLTTDMTSLQKAKRSRLSLGKARRLGDKPQKPLIVESKLGSFSSTANCFAPTKAMTLKRSLIKRPSFADMEMQLQKRFSKTGAIKAD